MSQPKLTLRPPPHREFVQGYPGIAGSSTRSPAHLAGNVEVRLGTKGLKAAWLRIELRKLETLPGGESWGELIGRGPIDVWTASKQEAFKSEDERGWEVLQTADFPFQVAIPEGLPPSAKLDKQAGVAYELVTSLCVRSKKGLLRKETTSSIIQNTHPIWLEKHELHSSWPVYHYPDEHETALDGIRVKLHRSQTCYGPGDQVDVRILVSSDSVSPVKLKNVSFSIRETITFRGGTRKAFGSKSAASQKTETLASKTKPLGKKVYKGDIHTFDLSCTIPKSHTLMTIQTAKHIEVAYTLRVQVEAGKKPIILDHLPITLSNFARTVSDATVDKIGFVPGLSVPAANAATSASATSPDIEGAPTSDGAESIYSSGGPTITRSQSFANSSFNAPYAGYPASDLRRRDTVMTQGTAVSGPGMAGRGVPGQVFSWGQYGAAQPFGSEAPRPAFAGPPSIFEGHELAPEENRALFHASNRPQSALILGSGVDPVFLPANSRPNSGARPGQAERQVTTIREGSEEMQAGAASLAYDGASLGQPQRQRSLSNPGAPTSQHGPNLVRPDPVRGPINSAEAEKERLYERARQQAERNQRRADERRAQYGQGTIPPTLDRDAQTSMSNLAPAQGQTLSVGPSAAEEKARLFERARAEAERYQASFSQGAQFPPAAAAGGSSPLASPHNLDDTRRASAQYWLQEGAGSGSAAATKAPQASAAAAGSASASGSAAGPATTAATATTSVSGRPAPYPTYMSAEEEKRRLYERAKAETEAFQRGELQDHQQPQQPQQRRSGSYTDHEASGSMSGHQAAASSGSTYTVPPGGWPREAPTMSMSDSQAGQGSSAAASSAPPLPAGSAVGEKEQLRRYYEAQDAVARHQATANPGGGASGSAAGGSGASPSQQHGSSSQDHAALYAPEVAQAVVNATPQQPCDTFGSPRREPGQAAPYGGSSNGSAGVYASPQQQQQQQQQQPPSSSAQSYLTEAEQQSAREKERLATHFAKKAARAEARAAASANSNAASPAMVGVANGGYATGQPMQPGLSGTTTPTRAAATLPPVSESSTAPAPAPTRPTASYANGYDHGRTASSGSLGGPRRAPSMVVGGRPLPGSSNHSPSASLGGSPVASAPGPPAIPAAGASEKAQLAAYYAAKDAAEQTAARLREQQQQQQHYQALGSTTPTPSSPPPPPRAPSGGYGSSSASRDWLPRIETGPLLAGGSSSSSSGGGGGGGMSSSAAQFYPRPRSDDTSSIYTEVLHDPEVLAGKKRAPPSIFSASSTLPPGAGTYGSPYTSRPSSVVYPIDPASASSTRWKAPPAPLRRDDPGLWRPRYAWVDEDDVDVDVEEAARTAKPPPPLPPKIPLSRNASSVA
ncbi:uncharacterized protein PSFLO_06485 [Pseudozyma flocculosa]|uniref:Arrestin C-terminal-like domain-containing protein n=1 Tax=Pseudozyma flocculosa TaxID=84751 RepID=A0A5C3F970_9BASI|nr:uncharacterized protein PSFLO_06485 [Pseudozyma flocculosa]